MTDILPSGNTRVFLIKGRAGPTANALYEGVWQAGQLAMNQGSPTRVRIPDPNNYGLFKTVLLIPGDPDLPELPITARMDTSNLSDLMAITNGGCDHDIQVHIGACKNPQDFHRGWSLIVVLEGGHVSKYGTAEKLGALDPKDNVAVNEEVTFQGLAMYMLKPVNIAEVAASTITRGLLDVVICDNPQCGTCGDPSDGCQAVYLLSDSSSGSPGLAADIIYTPNGGNTWGKTHVTTLGVNEPNTEICVGDNLIVLSQVDLALHYADLGAIQDGTDVWTRVATGFVATHGPIAAYSTGPNSTWIAADNGYIYFTTDPTSGVTVQNGASATTNLLDAIDGSDDQNIVAVGHSNTVIYTDDGGDTWLSVVGPSVGNNLSCVATVEPGVWWVGDSLGNLWYTTDFGAHWNSKGFSGSGSGYVFDVVFSNQTVGFMSHQLSGAGRLFRTIDGGATWYLLPEGVGSIPSNTYMAALATCDPNICFGAGLATNGTDGFACKAS